MDKPIHVINKSMSCSDFIFSANKNVISNYGVDVSMFKKSYYNIIHGKIDIRVPLLPVYVHENIKNQYLMSVGTGSLKIFL